ncbi:MAG: hypothetical protein HYS13_15705 [Planctomycetia bacterium]|nr:hypothetical protein [Planctomycetia bacterium]
MPRETTKVPDESSALAVARRARQEQIDFDIEFFDHVLARAPHHAEVLRIQGELLSRRGLTARAVLVDRRLVEICPADAQARYNLACSLALEGHSADALAELGRAIKLGYADRVHLEHDPDLQSLHALPEYKRFVAALAEERS